MLLTVYLKWNVRSRLCKCKNTCGNHTCVRINICLVWPLLCLYSLQSSKIIHLHSLTHSRNLSAFSVKIMIYKHAYILQIACCRTLMHNKSFLQMTCWFHISNLGLYASFPAGHHSSSESQLQDNDDVTKFNFKDRAKNVGAHSSKNFHANSQGNIMCRVMYPAFHITCFCRLQQYTPYKSIQKIKWHHCTFLKIGYWTHRGQEIIRLLLFMRGDKSTFM